MLSKPLSINSTYYHGSARFGKNGKAQDWTYQIFHQLNFTENKQALKELRESFEELEHYYKVSLDFKFPKQILFTKKGTLSNKAEDLTNIEKSLIDCIFLPKHFESMPPSGCENLNIDDKHVLELESRKSVSAADLYEIHITIEIKNIADL